MIRSSNISTAISPESLYHQVCQIGLDYSMIQSSKECSKLSTEISTESSYQSVCQPGPNHVDVMTKITSKECSKISPEISTESSYHPGPNHADATTKITSKDCSKISTEISTESVCQPGPNHTNTTTQITSKDCSKISPEIRYQAGVNHTNITTKITSKDYLSTDTKIKDCWYSAVENRNLATTRWHICYEMFEKLTTWTREHEKALYHMFKHFRSNILDSDIGNQLEITRYSIAASIIFGFGEDSKMTSQKYAEMKRALLYVKNSILSDSITENEDCARMINLLSKENELTLYYTGIRCAYYAGILPRNWNRELIYSLNNRHRYYSDNDEWYRKYISGEIKDEVESHIVDSVLLMKEWISCLYLEGWLHNSLRWDRAIPDLDTEMSSCDHSKLTDTGFRS